MALCLSMWLVMVQTAALSVKSFCCPQPWPGGTRHWEVTWLHMKVALKGLWIKADTLPEIPAPKLAVKNQVTSRRCQYVFVQQLTVVNEASPCPGNSCVTCPKEKPALAREYLEIFQEGGGEKAILQHMNMVWTSWWLGTACCSRGPEIMVQGSFFLLP